MTDESPPPTPEAGAAPPVPKRRRKRPDKRTRERRLSVAVTTGMPEWSSARVLQALRPGADPDDITGALAGLCLLADRAQAGDLAAQERMLAAQAVALDAMFARLTELAMEQNYATNRALYLKLALRAQAAGARTLEILGELKRPQPVTFVRQANIAAQQQVVNNAAPEALPDAAVTVLPATESRELPPAAPDVLDKIAAIVGDGDWSAKVRDADGVYRARARVASGKIE